MISSGRRLIGTLRHYLRAQDGSATIEFLVVFPFFFTLFLSTFELGMLTARQVMLDRGLDLTVREVRLGQTEVSQANLKARICENALILPDCVAQMRLEMQPLNPRNWQNIPDQADCIDRDDDSKPVRSFSAGVENQLMILRACSLFDPFFPTSGFGAVIPRESADAYALLSTSSFVVEP